MVPGFDPRAFWGMTLVEVAELLKAAERREEREWERAAWAVAHLLAPHSKQKIKPADLLGLPQRPRDPQADLEAVVAKHRRQMAEREGNGTGG